MRRGLGLGRGKGYRNLRGNDPRIHGDSAKGIKQPQRVSPFAAKYSYDDKIKFKINNLKLWNRKPSELPIYQINGKQYFRDARLGEYRNVKDPSDRLRIDDTPNSMLETPTIPYPEKEYIIQDREAGNEIESASSEKEAKKIIAKYEKSDKKEGIFVPDFYEYVSKDKVHGGLGDNRPDSDFDPKELKKGIKVEMEHTKDPAIAKEITRDHLTEFSGKGKKGYYDNLAKMEKKLTHENKSLHPELQKPLTMVEKKKLTKNLKLSDKDKDGVADVIDCKPLDKTKQDDYSPEKYSVESGTGRAIGGVGAIEEGTGKAVGGLGEGVGKLASGIGSFIGGAGNFIGGYGMSLASKAEADRINKEIIRMRQLEKLQRRNYLKKKGDSR